MQVRNRLMGWAKEHLGQSWLRPHNGQKTMGEIDAMLHDINDDTARVCKGVDQIVTDTRQAERVVAEGNDVLEVHNS